MVGVGLSALFLWLAVRNADLDEVGDALAAAQLGYVLAAVFVLGLDPNTYEVSGLDEACALVSFGAPVVGTRTPWGLDRCGHVTDPPAVGNAGFEVPLVVWTRTADPVEVALRPG